MKGLINTIQFLQPQVIEEVNSPINGKIKIVKIFGKPRIHVGGLLYSGGVVNEIWRKAIRKILRYEDIKILRVLILGLGGGTAARIISENFPGTRIIGVEIDREIIRLGKKYFDLDKIPNLKIIHNDAIKFVASCQQPARRCYNVAGGPVTSYDLIIVDLYLGEKVPKEAETLIFLKNLKKMLSEKGVVVFNRLFYKQHKQKAELFIKKLEKIFSKIELARTPANLLVFAQA